MRRQQRIQTTCSKSCRVCDRTPKSFCACQEPGKQRARRARRGRKGAENASKRLVRNPSSPSQSQRSPLLQRHLLPLLARSQRPDAKLLPNLARRALGSRLSRTRKHRKPQTPRYQLLARLLPRPGWHSRRRKPRLRLWRQLLLLEPMLTGIFWAQLLPVLETRELPNRLKSKSRKPPKTRERKMGTSRSSLVNLGLLLTSTMLLQPRNPQKEPDVQAKKVLSSWSSQIMRQ